MRFTKYITSQSTFKSLLVFIFIANFLDASLTMIWLEHHIAHEANPLMARLYNYSPTAFVLFKNIIVLLAIAGLYRMANRMLARVLIIPVAVIYFYVLALHAAGAAGFLIKQNPQAFMF